MKTQRYILQILLIMSCGLISYGQVGINTNTPTETLDVEGKTIVRERLYLENPNAAEIQHQNLLVKRPDRSWAIHNVNTAKYGPVNYTEVKFENVPSAGIQSYNTLIPTSKYIVAVQGYYYYIAGSTNTDVLLNSTRAASPNDHIEGPRFHAYENNGTWHIQGQVNQSNFQSEAGNTNVDIFMNIAIFRRDFFTKSHSDINVDMGGNSTGTAPLPPAFQ